MKINVGGQPALYPTPMTVVGVRDGESVNWVALAHLGNWNMESIMLSSNKKHYFNLIAKRVGKVSVNLVNRQMITATDYVGLVSGFEEDKTDVFSYGIGEFGTPVIDESPLTMECMLTSVIDGGEYEIFVLKVINTYVAEEDISGGVIDLQKVSPVLFDMLGRKYLATGEILGNCWTEGENYR